MTQSLYQSAIRFAGEKHQHQTVPGTPANYLLHLSNVAMEILVAYAHTPDFDVDFAVQTALLHDTIEDTDTTWEEVKKHFGARVADAVLALTKDDRIPEKADQMMDSLRRINQLEKEVGMVKLADRITNLQPPPAHWDTTKIAAYADEATVIAAHLSDKNAYLLDRLYSKIKDYRRFYP
jgi:guanosine-3',5'-bis(diphosphate) 3'-pyrophosphohydrolase